ncbi:MAG: D-alanyl-D-alanine carboxypeptidase family protein [Huintestinicola sp.]|uniref:D-alanyl-D-alanine carboxypeptidase family protein n=1 Tax=Huintestinicola sp. TaxID=2981661 RepID=UPI003F07AA50
MILKRVCALFSAAVMTVICSAGVLAAEPKPAPGDISAKAAVLIEASTGTVIWGKCERERLPMASTTKIMSTILTLESGDLDTEFVVDSDAVRTEGSSMGLREGDIVSKRDLCIGMLLPSGNDAANCAAVRVGGSMDGFAQMMNAKASKLGMTSTHFVTPSGLHDDDHYSTAADMALLTSYALRNPDFREICSSKSLKLQFGNPPFDRWLTNTNKLLSKYEGCIGVKTGFTDEAGRCLVSAAERNGVTLICVTLNAPDDWNDHARLFDYGFSVTESVNIGSKTYSCCAVGGDRDSIALMTQRDIILPKINGKTADVTFSAAVPQRIYAPVSEGETLGLLTVKSGSRVIDEIPLISAESLLQKGGEGYEPPLIAQALDFVKELLFK